MAIMSIRGSRGGLEPFMWSILGLLAGVALQRILHDSTGSTPLGREGIDYRDPSMGTACPKVATKNVALFGWYTLYD